MKTCLCILILTAASVVGACGYRTWQLLGDAHAAVKVATVTAASVDGRAKEALALIREAVIKADMQVTGVRSDLRQPIAALSASVKHVSGLRDDIREAMSDVRPMLNNVRHLTKQVDAAAPLFLDCDHNPDCAFNRFQGTSKAIERSAQNFGQMSTEVRLAVPPAIHSFQAIQGSVKDTSQSIATGFPKIVNNTGGIAENINRITKPRWWETPLKAAVAGAVVAGALK